MAQLFFDSITSLPKIIDSLGAAKIAIICGKSYTKLNIASIIKSIGKPYLLFNDFSPNPLHSDAEKGRHMIEEQGISTLVAIGGGSALDVAKCIKYDSKREMTIIAVPTTAGSGSESTKHIVVYENGQKMSFKSDDVIPEYVILDASLLATLPTYQRKCTMLDALCQGIESFWSVNSTNESKDYSLKTIRLIKDNWDEYINKNNPEAARIILQASNYSGQAINIASTTAAHAMSYKLTGIYGIPHGHAVAICLPKVWRFITNNTNRCSDSRGENYLKSILEQIPITVTWFEELLLNLQIENPISVNRTDEITKLTDSVNILRLANAPVSITKDHIRNMYEEIIK
jgi:alcohol dehydrogenase class IV